MEQIYVGIDAGWQTHCVIVLDAQGGELDYFETSTQPRALIELRDKLRSLAQTPEQIQVVIEDPTQPVVELLMEAGLCLWTINPKQTDRLRQMRWMASPKDDKRDAFVIADELRVRPGLYSRVAPRDPQLLGLREVTRRHKRVQGQIVSAENELRDLLRRYFPQYLQLEWPLSSRVMLELLMLIPCPERLKKVRLEQVSKGLGRTRKYQPQQVLDILKDSLLPLKPEFCAVLETLVLQQVGLLGHLCGQRDALNKKIDAMLAQLDQAHHAEHDTPSDVEIMGSMSGVGVLLSAILLSEAAAEIGDRDLESLRRKSIAPVTARTGKQGRPSENRHTTPPPVHMRYQGNRHLQDALYHVGRCAMQHNSHYKQRYAGMRKRGHTHGRACRQLADQILRTLFGMLRTRTVYDPNLHGATRRAGHKPALQSCL